jgi:hypothetical protein
MSRAKKNLQRRGTRKLTEKDIQRGEKLVSDWHWFPKGEFEQHLKMFEWDDPDYPEGILIECGNLARIHFRAPDALIDNPKHPRRRRDTTITFSKKGAAQSFLTFDPDHPDDRLYLCVTPSACSSLAQRFWHENPVAPRLLSEWAMLAGGRHAKRALSNPSNGGYPQVPSKPVGIMTAVVYFTTKKDDGPSFYIHRMGEVSCYLPILACDEQGRLWVCGGNYTSPTPGITD